MCGISGIINKKKQAVTQESIQNINDLITHRGPDDEGFFFEKNFAFGHRRLSILDLSSDGHQPMHYLEKYTITYNGEVYNYLEIKEELLKEGYKFVSHTDTEVILASYDFWGEECVNKFNGMWAFAIYDKEKEIIFCSRDRFGVKPFYYTEVDGKFVFGSEIKQLLEFYEERYVNENILVEYLLYGLEEHTNETFFENIFKLEQSHNLIFNLKDNTFEIKRYFDIKFDEKLDTLNEERSIEFLENKLYRSIDLRLRSDVKVGTCLSGGLDSSSIAAIASKKYFEKTNEKFVAIHAKSVEKKTDESEFAREVANHCNLNMIEIEPQLEDITKNIEEVIYTQEEPFGGPSIFMQYFVMKKAKEIGCTVMLDGQGGDETMFGYETYYAIYFATLLKQLKWIKLYKEFQTVKNYKVSKKQILKSMISALLGNKMLYFKRLFKKDILKVKYDFSRLEQLYVFKNFKEFQKRELMSRNLPHLLRYEDKNSMRHSVESRLPFIDYEFVQGALSLNDDLKVKDGFLKYLLRKVAEKILPQNIVWRTNKFGFEAPTDMWIDGYKDEMIKAIETSTIVAKVIHIDEEIYNNKSLLWKMYNVAIWEKIYKIKS
ncbi:asparagine synthase (glutamine-hydrolyzing) [Arcobacter caeni]|uniref:asparagine synthase (glutamine-hydrolyzing) n=1 Tax=Arcobacter caeni TaxID=1912877 RepID=A0A363CXD2_9BACT|nr:asparagine synthase (glutamine-hydrolyzing) [Arcobacter caeni]PUE63760.1 asparagine synthase (glutamine-hydrolyzing) [Arcobacter caeni]